jgi:hypothetical protein
MVEMTLRCGAVAPVAEKTPRSGATHLAMAGECIAIVPPSTSASMPSVAARLASSRMPMVDPASTWVRGPS